MYIYIKYTYIYIYEYIERHLPDIILLTQCYYHRGIRLNDAMKRFCLCIQPLVDEL